MLERAAFAEALHLTEQAVFLRYAGWAYRLGPVRPVEDRRRPEIGYVAGAVVLVVAEALLIALLLLGRTGHARARARLEERLRFETLLSQLSAGLIHVPPAEIDRALERSLGEIVGVLGGDRGALDEHAGVGPRAHISWTSPGVEALPRILDAAQFPWTVARLADKEIVRFSRTAELPEAAARDRASYERAHGGRLTATNNVDGGATFQLILTVDKAPAR